MWHGTSRLPVANLALKLLVVGYVAKLNLYEPHRHIADRTVRVGWSRRYVGHGIPPNHGREHNCLSVTEAEAVSVMDQA
jgi:hypothetical protein